MSFDEALAAEYSEPAIEETAKEPEQPPVQNLGPIDQPEQVKPSVDENGRVSESVWRANPDKYYQRGSKKGLPREKPLIYTEYKPSPNESELTGDLIGGAMFISMIDLFLPGLIVLINNFVVKDKKDLIKMEEMQLSKETMKRLEPVADASLRRLKLRGDPTVWLFITMMGCYAIRFGQIKFERKLEEAMKPKEEKI